MMTVLIVLQSTILAILGALHLYWAVGGTWGFESSLPTNEEGERMLNPKKVDSAIVGIGLFLFALFYLVKADFILITLPSWAFVTAGWFISTIFLLRAMGDFKYVGFFKRIKTTHFGKLDSNYYSPLCLVLGIIGVLIEIVN